MLHWSHTQHTVKFGLRLTVPEEQWAATAWRLGTNSRCTPVPALVPDDDTEGGTGFSRVGTYDYVAINWEAVAVGVRGVNQSLLALWH